MKLGLIGHNIATSQAPDIHKRLGDLFGVSVSYELFDLKSIKESNLPDLIKELKMSGFSGVNITFPFKEKVIKFADKVYESAFNVKSANTLIFQKNIVAHNTDYSGFIKSYNFHFKKKKPGKILIIGVGGVGRAISFALSSLGVLELHILDTDNLKGEQLLRELKELKINCKLLNHKKLESAISSFDGIINCTPLGHYDFPGCSLGNLEIKKYQWLYDVVYTPAKTIFLKKGELVGSKLISGIDLFIFQALDAFLLFSNNKFDQKDILQHTHYLRDHYFNRLYK